VAYWVNHGFGLVNIVSKIIYLEGSASLVIARNPSMYSTKTQAT
jgi:hypothetical protein